MTVSLPRSTRNLAVGGGLAAALLGGCADSGGDALVTGGRQVYLAQCIQCHNANPAIPGPVGPAVKGASRELLEAKIVRGEYPPGYRPQRPTKVMPPQPTLAPDIPALAAYLK
jgi:mono/diheme cytochrome c family protein